MPYLLLFPWLSIMYYNNERCNSLDRKTDKGKWKNWSHSSVRELSLENGLVSLYDSPTGEKKYQESTLLGREGSSVPKNTVLPPIMFQLLTWKQGFYELCDYFHHLTIGITTALESIVPWFEIAMSMKTGNTESF